MTQPSCHKFKKFVSLISEFRGNNLDTVPGNEFSSSDSEESENSDADESTIFANFTMLDVMGWPGLLGEDSSSPFSPTKG